MPFQSEDLDPTRASVSEVTLEEMVVLGATWLVFVEKRTGQFRAGNADYGYVYAEQYDDLDAKIRKVMETGKIRVAVPFTTVSVDSAGNARFSKGTATAIHAGNGNVLVTDGRTTGQLDRYAYGSVYRPFTAEDEAAYAEASLQLRAAQQAKKILEDRYAFPGGSIKRAVREAVSAARQAAGQGDDDGSD